MRRRREARPNHGYPRSALVAAGLLGGGAIAWSAFAVPALVKYPTDLDVSPRYSGTFTAFVDLSMAPLDEPLELPLTVDRRIEALDDESGSARVVVRETIDQQAGDLIDTTQTNVYVMDRSTVENLDDERAYSFEQGNVVDRSGTYRLNLPFDTSRDETYEIYKNEVAGTYELVPDGDDATTVIEGLELSNFEATMEETPLSDAYLDQLDEVVPLPESVTLDELAPHLLARGIDVERLTAALTPVLTPEDATALADFAAEPIELNYVLSFVGDAAVEPVTGAEIRVTVTETVGARPGLGGLPALQDVLARYPQVPEAAAAADALDDLAADPTVPLFEYSYEQTPASVADVADEARDLRGQVLLARLWVPIGLVAAALLTLAVGALIYLRRRRQGPPTPAGTAPGRRPLDPAGKEAR